MRGLRGKQSVDGAGKCGCVLAHGVLSLAGMEQSWFLITALLLGMVHSFDVDHLCAVSSFASHTRRARDAAWLGVRWAVGHSVALAVFGGGLVVMKAALPEWFGAVAEFLVGLALVAVGIWVIREGLRRRQFHVHWHDHDGQRHVHIHSHAHDESHTHRHKLTVIGMLHGLAGTSGVMVLIPVTLAQSVPGALLYIAAFGAGTTLSMALFCACAGRVFVWLARWQTLMRVLRGGVGATSCAVGVFWMLNSLQLVHP